MRLSLTAFFDCSLRVPMRLGAHDVRLATVGEVAARPRLARIALLAQAPALLA